MTPVLHRVVHRCHHLLKIFALAQIVMVPSHNKTGTTSDRALISIALQHLHQQSLDTLQKQSERYLAFSTGSTFPHEKNIHLCN